MAGIMCGGDLGEVEDDRGPELDVGLDRTVRAAFAQLAERGLLQRDGGLIAGCPKLFRGGAQHPRPRILGPVHPMAEAHQPLLAVEDALD